MSKKIDANPDRGYYPGMVVDDLNRLCRDAIDVQSTIKRLSSHGCNIIINRYGLSTMLKDGTENPASKMMVAMLSTFAEMERSKIKEGQLEGIEQATKYEQRLAKNDPRRKYKEGCKKGTLEDAKAALTKCNLVVRELRKTTSVWKTAKLCGVSPATVQKVKNFMMEIA